MKKDAHKWDAPWKLMSVWDDMSGKELDWSEVLKARMEEMDEFKKHNVYTKVSIEQCRQRTGKAPLKVRWVDINKGDQIHWEYRSRLVAKEINTGNELTLFAATPPWEAIKLLFSLAVTCGIGWNSNNGRAMGKKIEVIDVRRAYFNAPCGGLVEPPTMGAEA